MTTGLDDLQRRMLQLEEYGARRRQEKILDALCEERAVLLELGKADPEYIKGFEHAILFIGGEKALD